MAAIKLTEAQLRHAETLIAQLRPTKDLVYLSDHKSQGELLAEIQAIGDGRWGFTTLIRERCRIGKRHLFALMELARFLNAHPLPDNYPLSVKAIYNLAEPFVPPEAIKHVFNLVEQGTKLTTTQVRHIVRTHRGKANRIAKQHCLGGCGSIQPIHLRADGLSFKCKTCGTILIRVAIRKIIVAWNKWLDYTEPIKTPTAPDHDP